MFNLKSQDEEEYTGRTEYSPDASLFGGNKDDGQKLGENPRPPVYFQHGWMGSCMNWFMIGEDSLPFLAYERGFDVWLGNFRGNTFSREHIKYNVYSEQFWDYDVSAHAL